LDPDPSGDDGEPCIWTLDESAFPIHVWPGLAGFGQIAFDGNCDLIVGGGEELPYVDALYRVSKVDGSVSVLVAIEQLPVDSLVISAITYRESDERIYFTVNIADGPDILYAVDAQDQLHPIRELANPIHSLAVAPESFGSYGDQLIAVQYSPTELLAIDPDGGEEAVTSFASSQNGITMAVFGNDGTLYVAERGANRISTVTADGVIEEYYSTQLSSPVGLALSPDGTRMFVAHMQNWSGYIDEISIPGGSLTQHVAFEFIGVPVGMVVDGTNQVLYARSLENYTVIEMFGVQ
jgi:hypothetical protein